MATPAGLLLVLCGAAVCGASGLPALVCGRSSNRAQLLSAFLSVAGSCLGLCGVGLCLREESAPRLVLGWSIPGGAFSVAVDGLSCLFLVPVFLVTALGAIYGLGYWRQSENPGNGRKLRGFYGLLTAGMAVLVVARSSVLFLMAWEVMALAAYFLVATDDRQPAVRQAAWIYLVATHFGTMALLALFSLLRAASGTFEWGPIAAGSLGPWQGSTVFVLALVGFGLKAGIMPFHVWLPAAHANAPSHVSAILSGVMIKMGVYGLLRILGYVPSPPLWWGAALIVLGVLSGVVGLAAAIGQRDVKRVLAYSSIENMGIITLGLGLGLMGRRLGAHEWVVLGVGGGLFHVINHGLFKPLLFFGAGSVIHATHTREIDALGGLARAMPLTSLGFIAGAWAICGLPVMNGFMSEVLIYLGLFKAALAGDATTCLLAAMAAAGLAMIGALALACFIRAAGALFFGSGRSARAALAREAPAAMTGVMVLLVLLCLTVGVAPGVATPLIERALESWMDGPVLISDAAPLGECGLVALGLAALVALCGSFLLIRSRSCSAAASIGTWDCGYADPASPRLQYTASSFGEMLAGLFRWALKMKVTPPARLETFPRPDRYGSEPAERLLDGCIHPFFRRWADRFSRLRILQRGNVQIYLVYILATLLVVIAWAMLSGRREP